jgi:hypothetical protein
MPSIAVQLVAMRGDLDPSRSSNRARLRGMLQSAPSGSRERPVIDSLLAVPERQRPAALMTPWHDLLGRRGESRTLTPVDLELLRTIPLYPVKVSDDQARILARLQRDVGPGGPQSDRELIEQRFGPVRQLHEDRVERERLTAVRDELADGVDPAAFTASELGQLLVDTLTDEIQQHRAEQVRANVRDATVAVGDLVPPLGVCRAEAALVVERRLGDGEQARAATRADVALRLGQLKDAGYVPSADELAARVQAHQARGASLARSGTQGSVTMVDLLGGG